MSSDRRKCIDILVANGFWFKRRGIHDIYTDGVSNIPIPTGKEGSGRWPNYIKQQVRAALRRRTEMVNKQLVGATNGKQEKSG